MLFLKAIRESLYTNNIYENFNKDIKRKNETESKIPNEESLDKSIYLLVSEYNNKFSNRNHLRFALIRYELKMMIDGELKRKN